MAPSTEIVTGPPRPRRWLMVGLAVVAISFLGLGMMMGGYWRTSATAYGAVFSVLFLTFIAGWAISGAALRPRGSAVLGAVLGLVVYLVMGLAIAVLAALLVGATFKPGDVSWVVFWPTFLIGWLGLFGARWD